MNIILSLSFFLHQIIAEEAQMAILIRQTQQQIEQIKKLIETQELDLRELQQLSRSLNGLNRQVEDFLEYFKGTPSYEQALLELQSENKAQLVRIRSDKEVEDLPKDKELELVDEFQNQALAANKKDLEEINKLKNFPLNSSVMDISRLSLFTQISQWEAMIRLSAQNTQILHNLRKISENLERHQNRTVLDKTEQDLLRSAVKESDFLRR